MARASIHVGSLSEGDAVKRALEHPASKATATIVGLLLPMPPYQRQRVLRAVQAALDVTRFDDDGVVTSSPGDDPPLRLLDGSTSTGE